MQLGYKWPLAFIDVERSYSTLQGEFCCGLHGVSRLMSFIVGTVLRDPHRVEDARTGEARGHVAAGDVAGGGDHASIQRVLDIILAGGHRRLHCKGTSKEWASPAEQQRDARFYHAIFGNTYMYLRTCLVSELQS